MIRSHWTRCFMYLFMLLPLMLPLRVSGNSETLKIGVRTDAPPFSYKTNNAPNPYAGYSVSLCELIAERAIQEGLFCNRKFVEVDAANRFTALESGQIDMLCGASTVTLERNRVVDFSLFTFISGASFMYRDDSLASTAKGGEDSFKIGVLKGTTTEEKAKEFAADLRSRMGKTADDSLSPTVEIFQNHSSGLEKLLSQDLDVYLADREILLALRQQQRQEAKSKKSPPQKELKVSDKYYTVEPYALGISPAKRDLRFIANQVLSELYHWDGDNQSSQNIFTILNQNFNNRLYSKSLEYLFQIQRLPVGVSQKELPPRLNCQ